MVQLSFRYPSLRPVRSLLNRLRIENGAAVRLHLHFKRERPTWTFLIKYHWCTTPPFTSEFGGLLTNVSTNCACFFFWFFLKSITCLAGMSALVLLPLHGEQKLLTDKQNLFQFTRLFDRQKLKPRLWSRLLKLLARQATKKQISPHGHS